MPSVTLPSPEDKAIIKRSLPASVNKILTATVARLFVAHPHPSEWSYTQVVGALTLVRDNSLNGSHFLKIVDLSRNQGVLWEQELYDGFELVQSRPYFFTFAGDQYVFGLDFADEGEARQFYKKVANRDRPKKFKAAGGPESAADAGNGSSGGYLSSFFGSSAGGTSSIRRRSRIDKAKISSPSDFRHVGHVGWDPEKGFDLVNINDPEWQKLVAQLSKYGITKEQLQNKETAHIVMGFVQKHGGVQNVTQTTKTPRPPTQSLQSNAPPPPPPPAPGMTPMSPQPARQSVPPPKQATPPPPPPQRTSPT
ncbi:hypothetical protein H4R35_001848, partial [Dimargaris xerosporica]